MKKFWWIILILLVILLIFIVILPIIYLSSTGHGPFSECAKEFKKISNYCNTQNQENCLNYDLDAGGSSIPKEVSSYEGYCVWNEKSNECQSSGGCL